MIVCGIVMALVGGWLSFNHGKAIVLTMTSLIGSYGFMRGISYFGGGFPNEAELYHDLKNDLSLKDKLTNAFWIYICIFVASFIVCIYYQIKHGVDHASLMENERYKNSRSHDDYYKKQNKTA